MHKRREEEVKLQAQMDEMTQMIQEKSLELNRKSKEESDLRGESCQKEIFKVSLAWFSG